MYRSINYIDETEKKRALVIDQTHNITIFDRFVFKDTILLLHIALALQIDRCRKIHHMIKLAN